jgi:hypothetical protein
MALGIGGFCFALRFFLQSQQMRDSEYAEQLLTEALVVGALFVPLVMGVEAVLTRVPLLRPVLSLGC